jgi:hypothetical protein
MEFSFSSPFPSHPQELRNNERTKKKTKRKRTLLSDLKSVKHPSTIIGHSFLLDALPLLSGGTVHY